MTVGVAQPVVTSLLKRHGYNVRHYASGLAATCYTENMFRYLNAAVGIVFFGVATLGVLAWEHPYVAAGVIAFLVAVHYADKGDQKRLAAAADLRAMSPTKYEQHCADLLAQAG